MYGIKFWELLLIAVTFSLTMLLLINILMSLRIVFLACEISNIQKERALCSAGK